MTTTSRRMLSPATIALVLILLFAGAVPLLAEDYAALKGVKRLDTVFDYSNGSAQEASLVFPAIREVYRDKSVTSLPEPPRTVIVFHGEAVKLLVSGRRGGGKGHENLDQVADMIRQFKKDGVKMEVCMYAVRALGVDPDSLMPEIDRVGNGFISVAGYQKQGYALISVP